jgi:hypothetical protein
MNITAKKEIGRVNDLVNFAKKALEVWTAKSNEHVFVERQQFMLEKLNTNVIQKTIPHTLPTGLFRLNPQNVNKVLNIVTSLLEDCDLQWRMYIMKVKKAHGESIDALAFRKMAQTIFDDINKDMCQRLFEQMNWFYKTEAE